MGIPNVVDRVVQQAMLQHKRGHPAQGKSFNADKRQKSEDTRECARVVQSFLGQTKTSDVGRYVFVHHSKTFDPGPEFDLKRPGATRLAQHVNISLRNGVRIERAIRIVRRIRPPRSAYPAIDDEVRHMNAFWPKLPRRTLCEARSANLPMANAAECGKPLVLADAPVRRMAPCPRGIMRCAAPKSGDGDRPATACGSSSAIGPCARALAL